MAITASTFDDARLPELLFRYRARNYPELLTFDEAQRWEAHRAARLLDGAGGARTVEQLSEEIDRLAETVDERGEAILGDLYDYMESIAPHRDLLEPAVDGVGDNLGIGREYLLTTLGITCGGGAVR